MSKRIKLELNIRFSEKITSDDDTQEICENVLQALITQIDNYGISPKNSDVYVEYLEVNEPFSGASSDIIYV